MYEFKKVLEYVNDNVNEKISLTETAEQFGYSKCHFCKKFKQMTGMTFSTYVRKQRLHQAARDVLDGKKVIDIAFSCGYNSIGGFNKAFVKEFGCSPKNYTKKTI